MPEIYLQKIVAVLQHFVTYLMHRFYQVWACLAPDSWFESVLVTNRKDRFSRDEAHL